MLALYRGRSFWPSKLIEFRTWCPWSHVAHISDIDGVCYEAWKHGVRAVASYKMDHDKGTKIDLFQIKDSARRIQVEEDAIKFLKTQLGKPYDWPGVFRFVTRGNERDQHNPPSWFCFRLEFIALEISGLRPLERIPAWKADATTFAYSPHFEYYGQVTV